MLSCASHYKQMSSAACARYSCRRKLELTVPVQGYTHIDITSRETTSRATTSRNMFFRAQMEQVIRTVLGPVHATERSYRPFAANRSSSTARNLSDLLCSFTIELQSVVPPPFLSLTFATSSPSADVAFDLDVSLGGLQDTSHIRELTSTRGRLFFLKQPFWA